MKKIIAVLVFALLLGGYSSYGADVKVMRGVSLIEAGEDCKLISEEAAYKITAENMRQTYDGATTLKKMISEGWKISFVKDLTNKYGTEFLFIFTKD